jgi:release factor glutamine methyltransferase
VTSWADLLAEGRQRLGSTTEARRIAERASGWTVAELTGHATEEVPERILPFARDLIERRAAGEPLQYALGSWGFRTLDLMVDRRVLIPRPETEVVVGVALDELTELVGATSSRVPVAVDLGTGSGAIALSLAVEAPRVEVWATDASPDALAVARANLVGVAGRAAPRVSLAQGSWFDALPPLLQGSVDLIVSNPPYIADGEPLPAEVSEWEPASALRAGPTGLEDIEVIVDGAPAWLRRPGVVVIEVAPHQAAAAVSHARDVGFVDVRVERDLAGLDRVLVARL